MTTRELSQLHHLRKELRMDEHRLEELEARALPGARVLTGMPRAGGVSDRVGDCAVRIADLRTVIGEKRRRCLEEQERLERYIEGIGDSYLRQIFTYRFIEGLSWVETAGRLGGGTSPDCCRMAVTRYVRR